MGAGSKVFDYDLASGDSEDDEFEVERIIRRRLSSRGQPEYLVKWAGYPNSENTWQPAETMNCDRLITEFESKRNNLTAKQAVHSSSQKSRSPEKPKRPPIKEKPLIRGKSPIKEKPSTTRVRPLAKGKPPIKAKPPVKGKPPAKVKSPIKELPSRSPPIAIVDFSGIKKPGERRVSEEDNWDDWDYLIQRVDHMVQHQDELVVELEWKNGKKTRVSANEAYEKCPQQMLQYYDHVVRKFKIFK
jgi:hypothetical protein